MNKLLTLGLPGLASLILLANPNSNLQTCGKVLLGATGMSLIILSGGSTKDIEIDKLKANLEGCQKTVKIFDEKRKQAEQDRDIAIQLSTDLRGEHQVKLTNLNELFLKSKHELETEIQNLKSRLRETSNISTSTIHQIVKETYQTSLQKTLGLVDGWKRNYPDLVEFFDNLEAEIDKVKSWAVYEIKSYGQVTNVNELLDKGLWIQERIINRTTDIRIKGLTTIIKYFTELADDSIRFDEYKHSLQDIIEKAKLQIESEQIKTKEVAVNWINSNNEHKQNYEGEFTELLNTGKQSVQLIQELQDRIIDLESKLVELQKPRNFHPATRDDYRAANLIIEYLENVGFKLHGAYSNYHKHTATVFFQIEQALSISELNAHSEKLMRLVKTISPVQFANDDSGLIKAELKLSSTPTVEKSAQFKPPTSKSVLESTARGLLITGHPGAGKSSSMRAIGQYLGGQDAMRLALIPHAQDNESFESAGYLVINDKSLIYQAIAALDDEIKLRASSTKTDHRYLIVCVDELASIIKDEPKGFGLMEIIRQAAVEGRKLNVIVILGNHSQTTTAIDMDSQYREAFVQLWLCGAATHKLNMPNSPQLKQAEIDWINSSPYPCLVSINGKHQACEHPTHSVYNEYKDKGLPPVGIQGWEPNTVVMGDMNIPAKRRKVATK